MLKKFSLLAAFKRYFVLAFSLTYFISYCCYAAPSVTPWNIIGTIAGTGASGSGGDGGAATSAQFSYPFSIFLDSSGNIYIADQSNNKIRKINTSGIISTVAGNGSTTYAGNGVSATATGLYSPPSVYLDGSGNLYIPDGNSAIRKVNTGGTISTAAGTGTNGYSGDGGAATSAQLYFPIHAILDSSGNMYIADGNNNVIRKVNTSNNISTFASGFNGPHGLYIDSSNNLYVADFGNHVIKKVTSGGVVSTVVGTGTQGASGDGGAATSATLNAPSWVTFDTSGNMYIADAHNSKIRKVDTSGKITTIAGTGAFSYSGDGGPASLAAINYVYGVAVDSSGNVYFPDMYNQRIRKIYIDRINISSSSGSITLDGTTSYTVMQGVSGSQINLNGYALTFGTAGQSNSSTFSGNISGSTGLTKTGTGTLTLNGNSSFSGGTTITQGVLALGSNNAAGTGAITFNGGSIQLAASGITISNNTTLRSSATNTFDVNGYSATYSGTLSGGNSSSVIAITNSQSTPGKLTFSNAFPSYAGTTTVGSYSTLALGNYQAVGAGAITLNDGTLQAATNLTGASSVTNAIAISGTTNSTIDTNGNSMTFSGIMSGTKPLTITNSNTGSNGTLNLSGNNTYSGTITINGTTNAVNLNLLAGANISSASLNLTNNSSFTNSSGANQSFQSLSGSSGSTVNLGSQSLSLQSGSFAGSLTGSGGFTKTGSGALTLSGSSPSYTGNTTLSTGTIAIGTNQALGSGTIYLNSGTLQLGASMTGAGSLNNPITVSAASTWDTNGYSLDYTGILNGSSNLTLLNSRAGFNSTMNLSSSCPYNGTLSIDGSTSPLTLSLLLGADLSQAVINLTTGATVINNSGNTVTINTLTGASGSTVNMGTSNLAVLSGTFGGDIQGSGTLQKQGAGTFTLTGSNSLTGTLQLSAGTLAILGSGSSSNAQVNLDTSGATFDISSSSGAQTVQDLSGVSGTSLALGSNDLTFGTSNDTTFSGTITGTGGIIKQGSGSVTFAGNNNAYNGSTTLQSGTLIVDGDWSSSATTVQTGATLKGIGSVGTLNNQGHVAPGHSPGTITVSGNYTASPSSNLTISLTPSTSSLLNVTGTVNLNSSGLTLSPANGIYTAGTSFTIVQGSSVSGTFGTITSPLLNVTINYNATNVQLYVPTTQVIGGGAIIDPSQLPPNSSNGQTIVGVINQIGLNNPGSTLANLIPYLLTLSPTDLAHALAQLGGASYLTGSRALFSLSALPHNAMHHEMQGRRELTILSKLFFIPYAKSRAHDIHHSFTSSSQENLPSLPQASFARAPLSSYKAPPIINQTIYKTHGSRLWIQTDYTSYHEDTIRTTPGHHSKTTHIVMGWDIIPKKNDAFVFGVTGGTLSQAYTVSTALGKGQINTAYVGGYGSYQDPQGMFVDLSFYTGMGRIDTERWFTFDPLNGKLESTRHNFLNLSTRAVMGSIHALTPFLFLKPYTDLTYNWAKEQALKDGGLLGLNLSVQPRVMASFVSKIGSELSLYTPCVNGLLKSSFKAALTNEQFLKDSQKTNVIFTDFPTYPFQLYADGRPKQGVQTGANIMSHYNSGLYVSAGVDTSLSNKSYAVSTFLKLGWKL